MRPFIQNDMPVRIGLSYGSFTNYEFKTGVLPNGHVMFAAPFMGTAVVDSYRAASSGIKGMRTLVHPSSFMTPQTSTNSSRRCRNRSSVRRRSAS